MLWYPLPGPVLGEGEYRIVVEGGVTSQEFIIVDQAHGYLRVLSEYLIILDNVGITLAPD